MLLLKKLCDFPLLGRIILRIILKLEGGSQKSNTLRILTKKKFNVDVGLYSYGGCFSKNFNIGGDVLIGRYCSFASGVVYFGGNHPMESVSMSPYFYNRSFGYNVRDIYRGKLIIGNDVWCGHNVLITNKCKMIGNGAVIAAGAIVTKDVPAYAIVAGNPARFLRYRFDKNTIEQIEKSRWWEKDPEHCLKYYEFINDPVEFCARVNN